MISEDPLNACTWRILCSRPGSKAPIQGREETTWCGVNTNNRPEAFLLSELGPQPAGLDVSFTPTTLISGGRAMTPKCTFSSVTHGLWNVWKLIFRSNIPTVLPILVVC